MVWWFKSLWSWMRPRPPCPSEPGFGELVLAYMRSQIGLGEIGGNNKGRHCDRWRAGKRTGAWCAALVSWAIEQAAKTPAAEPVKRSHGAKRLFRRIAKAGRRVSENELQPGDFVCWHRGRTGGRWNWTGHIAVVSRVGAGEFWAIEGNRGPYPAVVAEFRHTLDEKKLIGFARLDP